MAGEKLAGALAEKVRELRRALEELRAGLCLALDFPEEEVECLSPQELRAGIERTAGQIRELLAAYRRAAPWRQGLLAVLAGRVNAGKSSLMNALLGRERAIVTELPGTTRDYLEESVDLDGLPVRLVDTAGLRDAGDAVELAGVERSRELIEKADLVLLVAERNLPPDKLDLRLANELGPAKTLVALNKSDLEPADDDPAERFTELGFETVALSAATGEGLDELAARILARVPEVETDSFGPAPNERQARNLEQALAELEALLEDLAAEAPYDLLGVRLETATTRLAEITGDITSDEILNSIFERFCIGK
jgi:tRNA modification GTPase